MTELQEKYERLQESLRVPGGLAVAFSGGTDSSFLLYTASRILGKNVLAVTASSLSFPHRELTESEAFCREHSIAQVIFPSDELNIEGFRQNPTNRCYLCKRELFTQIMEIARQNGITTVAEGSNLDDTGDYRPGLKAVAELGIRSPLREAELTKREIRTLSRQLGLSTWNKPSFACLASRFVYGETIDEEKLKMVDKAEQLLLDLGFTQVRVRVHGKLARIEVLPQEFEKLLAERTTVDGQLKDFGFTYVTMDLLGYRSGSMNEVLRRDKGE